MGGIIEAIVFVFFTVMFLGGIVGVGVVWLLRLKGKKLGAIETRSDGSQRVSKVSLFIGAISILVVFVTVRYFSISDSLFLLQPFIALSSIGIFVYFVGILISKTKKPRAAILAIIGLSVLLVILFRK